MLRSEEGPIKKYPDEKMVLRHEQWANFLFSLCHKRQQITVLILNLYIVPFVSLWLRILPQRHEMLLKTILNFVVGYKGFRFGKVTLAPR